jgi:transcription initiation factor IIE alpha subunit
MNLCSDGHDEVCHEGKDCPACEIKGELKDANDTIGELREKVSDLQSTIDNP